MKTTKRDILISKINALDGLTPDEKAQITEYIREKTFGLVWENKPEKAEDVLKESLPVFEEVPERRIFNGEQYPNHIIIEGDNLHALTALRYTHERKIDVIYIDPPYNTGNKDFVYNDSFVDKEDGFRHSKWLSFMEKRLTIAKELLSDKGVIFVSIDDNEMAECKLLLEKIYGGGNFVANICVINNFKGRSDDKYIATSHEYLLIFHKGNFVTKGVKIPEEYDKEYKLEDSLGRYRLLGLRKRGSNSRKEDRPNLFYPFYFDEINNVLSTEPINYQNIIIYPKLSDNSDGNWRWGKETAQIKIAQLVAKKVSRRNEYDVFQKDYLPTEGTKRIKPKSFWSGTEFSAETGTLELKKVFNTGVFNAPKPIGLVQYILEQSTEKDSVILDFFAGSGTTLHATMLYNENDGGHRQCILVTNNENQICENVTYERNRRVINGYPDPKGQMVMGLHANNLRYYRTAFVSQDRTRQNKLRLVRLAVDLLCIKEDVYEEQSSFFTIENINKKDFRYFSENGKRLLVIFNEDVIDLIVNVIKQADFEGLIKIYGFSPDSDFYSDEFSDINDRVKICALPAAIYNAYRNIIKRAKDAPPYADDTDDDVETVCTPSLQSQQPTLDL